MNDPGAKLSIAPNDSGFAVSGEIDSYTAPSIVAAIDGWSHDSLTIDLSGVEFLDSSGLRTLIEAHQRFAGLGGSLTLLHPTPMIRRLFEISGVDQYLNVSDADVDGGGEEVEDEIV